ncbi:polyamine ABC transporter ATP-binding protein, partial [Enterococcus faecalis]|nr:polyamine ABC transporter ATP-binding protein [Enterococcus faecalis]
EEAMAISDQIAVMNLGKIQQVGRPKELYHRPSNEFVATFIGRTNMISAKLIHDDEGAKIQLSNGYQMAFPELDSEMEQDVRLSIRPEEFIRS